MTNQPHADRRGEPSGMRGVVERFSLLLLFGLTFLFTGSIVLLDVFVLTEPLLSDLIYPFAAYGPFVAALLLSFLRSPERCPGRPNPARGWVAGFALVAAAYLHWDMLERIPTSTQPALAYVLWTLRAVVPATIFWLAATRVSGVREWLRSLLDWRVRVVWYLVALFCLAAASLVGMGVMALLGTPIPPPPQTGPLERRLPQLVTLFFGTMFYGGPLGEEPGWRGFALPRLQERFSPLVASLILGVLWGFWHVPFHLHGDYRGVYADGFTGLAVRVFTAVGLAIIFTWLYNRTGGNLLLAVILHTAVNNTLGVWLPAHPGVFPGVSVLIALLVRWDKMYKPLPAPAGRGYP